MRSNKYNFKRNILDRSSKIIFNPMRYYTGIVWYIYIFISHILWYFIFFVYVWVADKIYYYYYCIYIYIYLLRYIHAYTIYISLEVYNFINNNTAITVLHEKLVQIELSLDCAYIFPSNLATNGTSLNVKSIGKV